MSTNPGNTNNPINTGNGSAPGTTSFPSNGAVGTPALAMPTEAVTPRYVEPPKNFLGLWKDQIRSLDEGKPTAAPAQRTITFPEDS